MATAIEYLQSIIEQAAALLKRAEHKDLAQQLSFFLDGLHQIDTSLSEIDEALLDMILEAASEAG